MCPIPAPVFLHALRLLLPLAACSWGSTVAFYVWSNPNYIKHLYTSTNLRNFHLQILPNQVVDGTPFQTVYSAVLLKPISIGHVAIFGVKSRLYLCMEPTGQLKAYPSFSYEFCDFKQTRLENHFDVFESEYQGFLVSLGSDKGKMGPPWNLPDFSQFLPRDNEIDLKKLE